MRAIDVVSPLAGPSSDVPFLMSSVRSVHYRTEAADYSKEGWWTCSIASDISISSSMSLFPNPVQVETAGYKD